MWDAIGYVAAAVMGALVTILAVRVDFNLNDYLRDRRERRAQRRCQHFDLEATKRGVHINLWFSSPPGTVHFYCSGCGAETTSNGVDRVMGRAQQIALKAMKDAGIDVSSVKWEGTDWDR